MSIKDMIQAVMEKNASVFETAFNSTMTDKVASAMRDRFAVTENTEFDDEVELDEDLEQIDELSKKTLGSYVTKAAHDAAKHAIQHGIKKAEGDEMDRMMNRHMNRSDKEAVHKIMKTDQAAIEAPRNKAVQRLVGVKNATRRLTKD